MNAPAAVLALVLAMTAVGSSWLLWLGPTYGNLRAGYELLTGSTIVALAWAAWASLGGPLLALEATASVDDGGLARTLLLTMTLLSLAAVILRALPITALAARVLGVAAAIAGTAAFLPLASIRAARGGVGGVPQGVLELLLGSVLLGAVWVGMILGHWYLVERRLSNRYMVFISWVNVAAVVAGVASVLLSARSPVPCAGLTGAEFETCVRTFSPILNIGSMTIVLGLGVLALVALIAGFNVRLAREGGRSIQASTGMFYLAVILAPAAEFAAKVRFF